jgi:hypothetical protein
MLKRLLVLYRAPLVTRNDRIDIALLAEPKAFIWARAICQVFPPRLRLKSSSAGRSSPWRKAAKRLACRLLGVSTALFASSAQDRHQNRLGLEGWLAVRGIRLPLVGIMELCG